MILLLHSEKHQAMSKNVIHNFNLSIKNSADIKSSEHLTETIIKELAKVSKEMSQQKDIVQLWQEQNNQNATAILNNSIASAEGSAIDTTAVTMQNPMESISNTPLALEVMNDSNVSTGIGESGLFTTSTTAPIEGGAADNTLRTEISSFVSNGITPSIIGDQDLTNQVYSGISAQQSLAVPQMLQENGNEPTIEAVKTEIKKKLNLAVIAKNTAEIEYWKNIPKTFNERSTVQDFDGKKDQGYFKQIEKKQLDKIDQTTINNVNWGEVSELMILKLSELSKERKNVYLKDYYDKLIKEIKNAEINIQQLFLEHDELFLLLKSIFPNLPNKIIINTQKRVYPNLSPQRIYPDIGLEKMYFIWSGALFEDIKYEYNEREFQDDKWSNLQGYNTFNYKPELYEKINSVNLDKEFASYNSNVSKSSIDVKGESDIVPPVTKISSNTIQIGNKKWIDRFKFDYVLNNNEGGGEWMYNKAKKEMNASSFGAALIVAFAIEEGGWGKGNDQSNTHNAFSLLSKKAKSKAGTAHGNVITYANWDEGFKAFKDLINKKYASFNELLIKDNVSADDINKALFSGSFHKLDGYTDSDKGKAILGVIKYAIIFRVHDIKEQIKTLSKKNELLKANEVFKPVEENLFNPISKNKTSKDLEIEFYNNAIKELETEKKELEKSYDKL